MAPLNTHSILPKSFQDNAVVTELTEHTWDNWVSQLITAIGEVCSGAGCDSLVQTPAAWGALGVPTTFTPSLSQSLVEWLLVSVGANPVFYLPDWPIEVKAMVADNFLPVVSQYRGSYAGLSKTLDLFVAAGLLPNTVQYLDTRNREPSGQYTPAVYASGWDSTQLGLPFEATDRDSLQFRTLRLILDYHNPAGYGLVWADWQEFRADYSVAQDRCS